MINRQGSHGSSWHNEGNVNVMIGSLLSRPSPLRLLFLGPRRTPTEVFESLWSLTEESGSLSSPKWLPQPV